MSGSGIEVGLNMQRGAFRLEVELQLPGRGVTVLFGPSGCGKTTILRCIAGLERLPHCRIRIAGETWQDAQRFVPTHRRQLGFVFQEPELFPHLSPARRPAGAGDAG